MGRQNLLSAINETKSQSRILEILFASFASFHESFFPNDDSFWCGGCHHPSLNRGCHDPRGILSAYRVSTYHFKPKMMYMSLTEGGSRNVKKGIPLVKKC